MTSGPWLTRRQLLACAAVGATTVAISGRRPARTAPRVLVVGGGAGGVALALGLKARAPRADILLIERDPTRLVPAHKAGLIHGAIPGGDINALQAAGIGVAIDEIRDVDWRGRRARVLSGRNFAFDDIVLAPGIAARDEGIAGYDALAAYEFPHALTDGRGARRLAAQVEAMPGSGVMVIRAPAGPQRYPQGPYERATAIARYFKAAKPGAKIVILDDKDAPDAPEDLLRQWARAFPGMIEWVSRSAGGRVLAVDVAGCTLHTSGGRLCADVINFIPAQRAGEIAGSIGLANTSGWCPVENLTMRSLRREGAFVIGDAVAGTQVKTGALAAAHARACASALLA